MGFRFSRSVKLLPGLRLHINGSGISVSAGVRGAHINFGPEGTYTTLGLPGSGISFRQRIDGDGATSTLKSITDQDLTATGNDLMARKLLREGSQNVSVTAEQVRRYFDDPRFTLMHPGSGRRMTRAQLESRIRAGELKEKIEKLEGQVQSNEDDYNRTIRFWSPLPEIASLEDWRSAALPGPFQPTTPEPSLPDWLSQQNQLIDELTQVNRATTLGKILPNAVSRAKAEREFTEQWPSRQAQLQQKYEDLRNSYVQAVAEEEKRWTEAETIRTAWVKRLLDADLNEMHHTVTELVNGLKFPFETRCEFFFNEVQALYLHVDLPEVDDVVPKTQKRVLKNGETRELHRPAKTRNSDYATLVLGQLLYLAAEMFSYLPLLQTVFVAAYTQRLRRAEEDPIDSYVVDAALTRECVLDFAQNPKDLVSFFARQGARMSLRTDDFLNPIKPPNWISTGDLREAISREENEIK